MYLKKYITCETPNLYHYNKIEGAQIKYFLEQLLMVNTLMLIPLETAFFNFIFNHDGFFSNSHTFTTLERDIDKVYFCLNESLSVITISLNTVG